MMDVVPGAAGQHEVEGRPVDVGVVPDRRDASTPASARAARRSGQSSCRSGNWAQARGGQRGPGPGGPRPERGGAQLPMGKWQATWWPGPISRISGTSSAQRASARGQRVRKRQPDGGLIGLGGSPVRAAIVRGRLGVGLHRGGQQGRRVVVRRRLVEEVGRCDLAEPPEVHDGHPVADVLDDGQVVRNEEDREVVLLLQVLHQVEDLRLDRHVEGGDDLVAHQQLRLEDQGAGDADALALAAGELAGTPGTVDVGVDADLVEHGAGRLDPLLLAADLPDGQRLRHDVDRPGGVGSARRSGPGRSSAPGSAACAGRRG